MIGRLNLPLHPPIQRINPKEEMMSLGEGVQSTLLKGTEREMRTAIKKARTARRTKRLRL